MKKILFTFTLFAAFSAYAATISGVITDAGNDEPIAGATVLLISGFGGGGDTVSATSGADGTYEFTDLAEGFYFMVIEADGFAMEFSQVNIQNADQNVTRDIAIDAVGAGTISGTVINSDDEPIAGATVVLSRRFGGGGGGMLVPVDTTTTNAEGAYSFTDIEAPANYAVTVSAPDYNEDFDDFVQVDEGQTETVDFQLDPYVPPTGAIAGTVTNADTDEPAVNAQVILLERQFGGGGMNLEELARATTDAEGGYIFTELEPSQWQYVLVVGEDTTNFIEVGDDTTIVDLQVAPEDIISIQDAMQGRVNFSYSFQIAGDEYLLNLTTQKPTQVVCYDLTGRIVLNRNLSPGSHYLPMKQIASHSILFLSVQDESKLINRKISVP
jgi:hypothetical protein